MKTLKHYLSGSIGLILFVSVIAFSLPQNAHTNVFPPGDKEVLVVNTPAQAVPVAVQGTTNIAGTINVANTPTVNAKQSGNWTVQVGNEANNPVLMRDVDRPTAQPFQYEAVVTLEDGQGGQTAGIPIPSGKLLVIENVSAFGAAPDNQRIQAFSILTHVAPDNTLRDHYLQFTKQDTGSGTYEYTVSQQVRIYGDTPSVGVRVYRAQTNGSVTFRFTVSGYFVNKYN